MEGSLVVFVDTVGEPVSTALANRRCELRSLFTLGVFRDELCARLSVPPERARLWLVRPDGGEVLLDLSLTAAECHVTAGAKVLLEVATSAGEWLRPASSASQVHGVSVTQQARALVDGLRGLALPPAPPGPHAPPPAPPSWDEERQLREAMALSSVEQSNSLQHEEALYMALAAMGLKARRMPDDGNCLFHALSDQLFGTPTRHAELRSAVCAELRTNRAAYEAFVPELEFESYVAVMACDGTYATHLEIQAFANAMRKQVLIYSDEALGLSEMVIEPIVVAPAEGSWTPPPLRVTYQRGNHYNAVVPIDADTSTLDGGAAVGGCACPYCGSLQSDVDMHIVAAHADLF